jgi:hypothetical protein
MRHQPRPDRDRVDSTPLEDTTTRSGLDLYTQEALTDSRLQLEQLSLDPLYEQLYRHLTTNPKIERLALDSAGRGGEQATETTALLEFSYQQDTYLLRVSMIHAQTRQGGKLITSTSYQVVHEQTQQPVYESGLLDYAIQQSRYFTPDYPLQVELGGELITTGMVHTLRDS